MHTKRDRPLVLVCLVWLLASACYTVSPGDLEKFYLLQSPPFEAPWADEQICHVHKVATVATVVPERAGMCVRASWHEHRYIKTKLRRFPNSYWDVHSCACEGPDSVRLVSVCPQCRAAERAWRASQGLPLDEESPLSEEDSGS